MNSDKAETALSPGPIPLYHQLEQEIRARILAGEFEPGAPMPTEERLCEQYGVSRITVRRALDSLIADGLVTKRRGVGTFAAAPPKAGVRSIRLSGSLDEFLASAGALATEALSKAEIPAPREAVTGLRLREGDKVIRFELLANLEGAPVAYFEMYLPLAIGQQIRPQDIGGGQPVIRMIERKLNLRVGRAEQIIEAELAGEVAGKYLELPPTTPLLRVTRTYFDLTGAPVEMIVARNHPDRYKYAIDFVARPRVV
jgi:GntR family transcriptional regulator